MAGVLQQASALPTQTNPVNRQPTTPSPSLQSLQPTPVTPSTFGASTGTAATTGAAPQGTAAPTGPIAGIQNGNINPNDATNAASQLDAITAANSPYIQQATQQGLLSAASRGLENSSLGAGAAEAAAVQAAAPLAEQNAQGATAAELQNSQLKTQASEFNAGQQNANQQLNAQLATQTNQFNASQQQAAAATNAAAVNAINQQMQSIQAQLSTQFLSGSQAQTLANIQGQWSSLIAQNQSAASFVQSSLSAMSSALSNPQVSKDQANYAIAAETQMLQTGLNIINIVNGGPANSPAANAPGLPTLGGGSTGGLVPPGPNTPPGPLRHP